METLPMLKMRPNPHHPNQVRIWILPMSVVLGKRRKTEGRGVEDLVVVGTDADVAGPSVVVGPLLDVVGLLTA
jgi:hypothetical protein